MHELQDLPAVARRLGRSEHAVRRMLRKLPDVEARLVRVWGRRLLAEADVRALADAFAGRDAAARPVAGSGRAG